MMLNIRSIAAIGAGDTNTGKAPKQSSNRNIPKSREIMTGFLERKKKEMILDGVAGEMAFNLTVVFLTKHVDETPHTKYSSRN
jgi:hypothetical protein